MQSALVLPVPEAEAVVAPWRELYDPVAPAGVPAHITLIVPWLPPDEITGTDLAELAGVLAGVAGWTFDLTHLAWFARRVLWVAPEPAEPFRRLTDLLAGRFGTPPWEDEFDEVVPHLTVAHASGDGVELHRVERVVTAGLPISCRATEVWVMTGDGTAWSVRARLGLGPRSGPGGRGGP